MKKKIHDASLMTAIKTPYKSGGEIDLDCYDELVTEQMRNGVEGLIVCGTTGEGHLMDWEEHLMLIAHSVNRFGDELVICLLYTSPSPRDQRGSRMPSSA